MFVKAWNNGRDVYGLRVGHSNRDKYFDPAWTFIHVDIDGHSHRFDLTPGFWRDCPEFRDQGTPVVRKFFAANNSLDWPARRPPHFILDQVAENNFRLREIPTRDSLNAILHNCLETVIHQHRSLLDNDVSERAVTHQLASVLRLMISPSFDVDVEYNRHGIDPKRLELPPRHATDHDVRATTVFPDIVVHVRNTDDWNLLVLEVKKPGEPLDYDELKLRAFKAELGYLHAGHIVIGVRRGGVAAEVQWLDA